MASEQNENYFQKLAEEGKQIYKLTNKSGDVKYVTDTSAASDVMNGTVTNVAKAVATKSNVYPDSNGNLHLDKDDALSFTFGNGKINLTASKDMQNTQWVNNIINNSAYKQIYEAYSKDPTGTTEISDGEGGTYTLNEALQQIQDGFNEAAAKQRERNKERRNLYDETGVKLSDDDISIYAHSTKKSEHQNSDSEVVFIPQVALSVFDELKNLDSYNEDYGTISAKDFYKWYTTDDGTEGKDNKLLLMKNLVTDFKRHFVYDENSEDAAAGATEYAKAASFLRTLENDRPDNSVPTGARILATQAGESFLHNISTVGYAVLAGLENIPVINLGVKAAEAGLYELGGVISGTSQDKLDETLGKIWETGQASELMSQLDFIDKEAYQNFTDLSDAAVAGSIIGGAAAEVLKQVLITDKVGKAFGGMASVLASGATEAFELGEEMSLSSTMSEGIRALLYGMNAEELGMTVNAVSKFAGTSANILAQGVSDTILNDPELLDVAMFGNDGDKILAKLAENTAMNAFGELAGLGTSTVVDAIADTRFGVGVQKLAYELNAKKLDMHVKFAEELSKRGIKVNEKVVSGMRKSAENSREAAKMIAEAAETGSKEELVAAKNASRAFKAQSELAIKNDIKNSESAAYNVMMSNKEIRQSFTDAMKSVDTLYKLEKKAGMSFRKGQYVSIETSNYIAARQRVMNLGSSSKLTEHEENVLNVAQNIVDRFRRKNAEVVAAVDDLEKKFGAAYHAQIDFELKNHLLSPEMENKLLKLRKEGKWGTDGEMYIGTIAIKEGENVEAAVQRWLSGSKRDFEGITSGFGQQVKSASEEYLDPVNTLLARQIDDAQKLSAINNRRLLAASDIAATEIDITGKPLSRAEFKKAKKAYDNVNASLRKSFLKKDIAAFDFSNAFRTNRKSYKSIVNDPGRMDRALGLKGEKQFANAAYGLDDVTIQNIKNISSDIPEYKSFGTDDEFKTWFDALDKDRQAIIERSVGGSQFLDSAEFNKALTETNMVSKLTKYDIAHNKELVNSDSYKDLIRDFKKQNATARQEAFFNKFYERYSESLKNVEAIKLGKDEFTATVNEFTEALKDLYGKQYKDVNGVITNSYFKGVYDELANRGIPVELVDDYFMMSSLKDFVKSDEFGKLVDKNLSDIKVAGNVTNEERIAIIQSMRDAIEANVNSEWAEAAQRCMYNGVSDHIDMSEVNRYVTDQMKEFTDVLNQPNVMKIIGEDGEYHVVQLSPLMADFVNANAPTWEKSGFVSKLIRKTNQVFRIGTTGFNLRSMVNQFSRDPINAWLIGSMTQTIRSSQRELETYLGGMSLEKLERELGTQYEVIVSSLKESGAEVTSENVAKVVSSTAREEAKSAYSGMSMQEQFYADMTRTNGFGADSVIGKTLSDIKKSGKGYTDKFTEGMQKIMFLNEARENYLRRAVYMNNLNKAVKNGHTIQEAKNIATYIADNATTDFSRTFAWGNSIVRHVPYLGAAINGTASFWRMLEIDPVGVSCRLFGGLAFPTMALTAQSLQGENLEVYKNIPEYEKKNSLVFVVDGTKFSMPIPQELSAFIAPFRQAVEKAYGANDHSWLELAANDILSVSPIDLDGFVDLDDSDLARDNGFMGMVSNEAATLFSQLSPELFKTAYMWTTGIDPFTKKKIDKSFRIYNEETGEWEVQDYTTDSFALWLSDVFGEDLSASSAYALLKSLFGQGITNAVSDVMDVVQGNYDNILDREAEAVTKPFYGQTYDLLMSDFNQQVKVLEAKRDELMSAGSELAEVNQQILFDTDPEKLEAHRTKARQLTQDYIDEVKNLVDRYVEKGGKFGKTQVGKIINLMIFNSTTNDLSTEYARQNAKQAYYDAKNQSLDYLRNLGFKNTTDYSMLGYLSTNEYGEVKSKLVLPSQMQGIEQGVWNGSKITLANISTKIEDSGLGKKGDAYKTMQDQVDAAYDRKDYEAVDRIYKEWDKKVMDVIAPVIAQNDVGDILNYGDVIDYLDDYIKVPSDAMGKGKYYSSKTGLNKQRGYAKSFIQKLYDNMNK